MTELAFATLAWLGLSLVVAATDSSRLVLDLVFSITGFCLGFMVAAIIYRNNTQGRRDGS